ncbi:MAG: HIT domain-containing protein [Endozoicomonas sp.]
MMKTFQLDKRLAQDCLLLGELPLCQLLLMNDRQFSWFILVPKVTGIEELYELDDQQLLQLNRESVQLSAFLSEQFQADKMNVAALGNIVRQLHIHHVVRYESDPAWPGPVWGKLPALAYSDSEVVGIRETMASFLARFK